MIFIKNILLKFFEHYFGRILRAEAEAAGFSFNDMDFSQNLNHFGLAKGTRWRFRALNARNCQTNEQTQQYFSHIRKVGKIAQTENPVRMGLHEINLAIFRYLDKEFIFTAYR